VKSNRILIDTGPLVAFLNKRDQFHEWSLKQLANLPPPLYTCEAVLSEAWFMLQSRPNGAANLMSLLQRELIVISFALRDEIDTINKLLKRYQNIPMSLADACLVRMSELFSESIVLTFDSDFTIYRKNSRRVIPTITPDVST